jgi:hypothetical protein
MRGIGKSIKSVEQDLEARDLTAKEHIERKPSSEKFNKAKIKEYASRDLRRDF